MPTTNPIYSAHPDGLVILPFCCVQGRAVEPLTQGFVCARKRTAHTWKDEKKKSQRERGPARAWFRHFFSLLENGVRHVTQHVNIDINK